MGPHCGLSQRGCFVQNCPFVILILTMLLILLYLFVCHVWCVLLHFSWLAVSGNYQYSTGVWRRLQQLSHSWYEIFLFIYVMPRCHILNSNTADCWLIVVVFLFVFSLCLYQKLWYHGVSDWYDKVKNFGGLRYSLRLSMYIPSYYHAKYWHIRW